MCCFSQVLAGNLLGRLEGSDDKTHLVIILFTSRGCEMIFLPKFDYVSCHSQLWLSDIEHWKSLRGGYYGLFYKSESMWSSSK